jgi:hypothetical protein
LWICGFSLWNLRPPWFAVAIFGITWKCRCLKWGALFNHQNSDFGVQKGHLIWNIFIWLMFYSWPLPLPCRLHPDWGLGSSTWRWVGSVRWTLSYLNWRLPSYPLRPVGALTMPIFYTLGVKVLMERSFRNMSCASKVRMV